MKYERSASARVVGEEFIYPDRPDDLPRMKRPAGMREMVWRMGR